MIDPTKLFPPGPHPVTPPPGYDINTACRRLGRAIQRQAPPLQPYVVGLRIMLDLLEQAADYDGQSRAQLLTLAAEALHDARLKARRDVYVLVLPEEREWLGDILHTTLYTDMLALYCEGMWRWVQTSMRSYE